MPLHLEKLFSGDPLPIGILNYVTHDMLYSLDDFSWDRNVPEVKIYRASRKN